MTFNDIKDIIREIVNEARVYGAPDQTSTEYELTPDEITALKGMTVKQRQQFAQKKLQQARKSKGMCVSCGQNPGAPKAGGTVGTYCKDCLARFRTIRNRLSQNRGSCTRCSNPPLSGKKLCQKCTDELEMQRLKALDQGLCLRCKKQPAIKNEKGRQTLYCKDCIEQKKETERQRKLYQNLQNPSEQTIEEVFNRAIRQTPTVKYHENARLEVAKDGPYGPFLFFRNGKPIALVDDFGPERRGDEETFHLGSIAVVQGLRKIGIGRAIFTYLFDLYPKLQNIQLHSSKTGKPFYQKIGGERENKEEFTIKRNKFQPSSLNFTEIPYTVEMTRGFSKFFRSIWK